MTLNTFLTGLLSNIIRPIIQEELAALKIVLFEYSERLQNSKKIDRETDELIKAAESATTPEEVRAHLRRLKDARAKLNT